MVDPNYTMWGEPWRDIGRSMRMNCIGFGCCLVAAAILFTTVIPSVAFAAIDTKTYMGAFCVPMQNIIGGDQRANLLSTGGKATAKAGTTARVVCPIIKDNTGDVGLDVRINVFLATGQSNITCTLASYWWQIDTGENWSNMLNGGEAVQAVNGSNINTTIVFSH